MFILDWLKIGVSWILVQFHSLLTNVVGMNPGSGWTWAFSIVGLVIVIRIALIPLFVKQIKSQRNLQLIQPQMKEIQKKYTAQGVFQWEQYATLLPQAHDAQIFGVPLYGTFMNADETPNPMATRIVAVIMILLMTATSFITQRQLIVKNSAPDNPMVRQQKILLYVFPLIFAVSGINFPIGVLIYWFTTNLWSMGQQFWVIRNNPQPGTPAFEAKEARQAAKVAAKNGPAIEAIPAEDSDTTSENPTRVQPKKQSRSQRKKK